VALRDLQWRRRRFITAVAAVGIVFAITLLLDGFTASLHNEVVRTVGSFHADTWVVQRGSDGPFAANKLMPASALAAVEATTGVTRASPLLVMLGTAQKHAGGSKLSAAVFGVPASGFGSPPLVDGRAPRTPDEAVADRRLGVGLGKQLTVASHPFTIVGHTKGKSIFAGTPVVYLRLQDAQHYFLNDAPLITGIAVQGEPRRLPPGLTTMSNSATRTSLTRPVQVAVTTIGFVDVMLWITAAGIIGSILYMTSLERIRDFASLKAMGARDRQVVVGIGAQAVVLSIAAAATAFVAARLLEPFFPIPVEIPLRSYPLTLIVALGVGMLGSFTGVRRAVATDPALAFGA
jgi:putative ABC transport system permease protein